MTQSIGWWEWDPDNDSMTIASTGERVVNLGPFDLQSDLSLPGGGWMHFEYRRDDLRYPVLVQSGSDQPKTSSRSVWRHLRLDHIASARLWARQKTRQLEFPPYSLWDRVDDLMVDAISCWPRDLIDAYWPNRLYVNGGWLNGEWSETYLRRFQYSRGRDFPPDEDVVTSNWGPPADTAPVWQYVDASDPVNRSDLTVGIGGDEQRRSVRSGLSDLEESMPYLTRKSGCAVLLPSRAHVSRQHTLSYLQGSIPDAMGIFRYVDDDASCLFAGILPWPPSDALFPSNPAASENHRYLLQPKSRFSSIPQFRDGAPRPWRFSAAVTDHRYARPGDASELSLERDRLGAVDRGYIENREALDWLAPELGLWRRLRSAILQAWLIWPGRVPGLVAEEDATAVRDYKLHKFSTSLELPLPSASQVCVAGAHVGGRWMSGASVVATCLPGWRLDWRGPTLLELTTSPGGPARPIAVGRRKILGI